MDQQNKEISEMNLQEIRCEIDQVDSTLKEAFLHRMQLVDRVAEIKSKSGDPIYNPEREAAMIRRLTEDVDPQYISEYEEFIRSLLRISRSYQEKKLTK
jgi:chorismate mutase/prephenate dehydrogenase